MFLPIIAGQGGNSGMQTLTRKALVQLSTETPVDAVLAVRAQ